MALQEKTPKALYAHLPPRALEVQACLGHSVNVAGQELVFKHPGTGVPVRGAAAFGTAVSLCWGWAPDVTGQAQSCVGAPGHLQGCAWLWHRCGFSRAYCQTFQIRKLSLKPYFQVLLATCGCCWETPRQICNRAQDEVSSSWQSATFPRKIFLKKSVLP